MNAIKDSSFSLDDLNQLNELFKKLDQEPARPIHPRIGDRFEKLKMDDQAEGSASSHLSKSYILETRALGVMWKGDVLRKAKVVACTPDRLMVHNLAVAFAPFEQGIVNDFVNNLKRRSPITPNFELHPSALQGFLDIKMSEQETETLFDALIKYHPQPDFSLVNPSVNEPYNADTMTPRGGQLAGQNCRVAEVIHPGLTRTVNNTWRIKALVQIKNITRDGH